MYQIVGVKLFPFAPHVHARDPLATRVRDQI